MWGSCTNGTSLSDKKWYDYGELRCSSFGIIVPHCQTTQSGWHWSFRSIFRMQNCVISSVSCKDPCCLTGYVQRNLYCQEVYTFETTSWHACFVWKWDSPLFHIFFPFHPLVYHHVPHSNGEIAEKPHESGLMINPATISIFLDSDSRWRDWVTTPVISRKVLPSDGLWAYSIHKMWKKICFSERNSLVNYSVSKAIPKAYNISFMFP